MTDQTAPKAPPTNPGVRAAKQQINRILRVDQAGEFGAQRIYKGQLDVMSRRPGMAKTEQLVRHMAEQEDRHHAAFSDMVAKRNVRPTALEPLWNVAGYAMGAATALMGEKAAMACTAAVEEVIDEHYAAQQQELEKLASSGVDEPELKAAIDLFRAEEAEHHETAIQHGAEQAPAYRLMSAVIKRASKTAIWLSERL